MQAFAIVFFFLLPVATIAAYKTIQSVMKAQKRQGPESLKPCRCYIFFGAPGRTRTTGKRFRKPLLYPPELRAHDINPQLHSDAYYSIFYIRNHLFQYQWHSNGIFRRQQISILRQVGSNGNSEDNDI
jgi:hypothetical protein